ncbi:MGH1-like glycoside hydrolase domain-containing protein [Paenibacillus daejeonensis]|uniref:MGH1-like glycoside hydrolase domain-containing protein n=1 Tax=Paenibacillus daejeonensis TaxID=135193 RepID=UPI0003719371|nr:hypothetical protein [Paenibacillus daejeonensis]
MSIKNVSLQNGRYMTEGGQVVQGFNEDGSLNVRIVGGSGGGGGEPDDDSVSTAKLQEGAVTEDKLSPDVRSKLNQSGGEVIASGITQGQPSSFIMEDAPIPVISDGLPFSVGQLRDTGLDGNFFFGATQPLAVVSGMETTYANSFNRTNSVGYGSLCLHMAGLGLWSRKSHGATDVKLFGYPGVSIWSGIIQIGANPQSKFRLIQRWYAVPGVRDALYCEVEVAPDASNNQIRLQNAVSICWGAMSRSDQTGITIGYDAALDGSSFITIGNPNNATWRFVRPINHKSTGHHFATTYDNNQHFSSGALPTGTDTLEMSGAQDHNAYLSASLGDNRTQKVVFRWVVGIGVTEAAAKQATANVPNTSFEGTLRYWNQRVSALPVPTGMGGRDLKAYRQFLWTMEYNKRSNSNYQPERQAYNGKQFNILFASLARWNASWSGDTGEAIVGMVGIDPQLVRDQLDYNFNYIVDPVTGFWRGDPTFWGTGTGNDRVNGRVQNAAQQIGRAALRYLKATDEVDFINSIYDKMKLVFTFWITKPGYQHPDWAQGVYLLTAPTDTEIQEESPLSPGGVTTVTADVKTQCELYDYAMSMLGIAQYLSKPQAEIDYWTLWTTRLRDSFRQHCWDDTQGWFKELGVAGADKMAKYQYKTFRSYLALWSGIATQAQADRMLPNIMDPNMFFGQYGMRTMSRDYPSYNGANWMYGGSRPMIDGTLIAGMYRYGFRAEADIVLSKWVNTQAKYGTTPEAIHPETGVLGYAKFMVFGAGHLIEALLYKHAPELLYNVAVTP